MSTHDLTTRMVHCTPHPSSSGTFERVNGESRTQLRADGAEARRSRPAKRRMLLGPSCYQTVTLLRIFNCRAAAELVNNVRWSYLLYLVLQLEEILKYAWACTRLESSKERKDVAKVAIFGSTVARAFTIDCMTVHA